MTVTRSLSVRSCIQRIPFFLQDKRITAADALAHPYLDEGRLRYHSCMCTCCHNIGKVRHYTSDFEPLCKEPFRYDFEDDLTSVFKVKGMCTVLDLLLQNGSLRACYLGINEFFVSMTPVH